MLTGEVKQCLIEVLTELKEKRRRAWWMHFMALRPFPHMFDSSYPAFVCPNIARRSLDNWIYFDSQYGNGFSMHRFCYLDLLSSKCVSFFYHNLIIQMAINLVRLKKWLTVMSLNIWSFQILFSLSSCAHFEYTACSLSFGNFSFFFYFICDMILL